MTTALERTFVLTAFRISILMAVASLIGCTVYSADPITAAVVDADTGTPIEGVNVLAAWELKGGMEYGAIVGYVNVMETTTDKEGRFHFPAWGPRLATRGKVRLNAPLLVLLKSGYQLNLLDNNGPSSANAPSELRSDWNGKRLVLRRLTGAPQQQKESLWPLRDYVLPSLERNGRLDEVPQFMCAVIDVSDRLGMQGASGAPQMSEWLRTRGIECPANR